MGASPSAAEAALAVLESVAAKIGTTIRANLLINALIDVTVRATGRHVVGSRYEDRRRPLTVETGVGAGVTGQETRSISPATDGRQVTEGQLADVEPTAAGC